MTRRAARIILALAVACLALSITVPMSAGTAPSATPKIVKAANSVLATLSESVRKRVMFAFDDEAQRKRWSNLPVRTVPR